MQQAAGSIHMLASVEVEWTSDATSCGLTALGSPISLQHLLSHPSERARHCNGATAVPPPTATTQPRSTSGHRPLDFKEASEHPQRVSKHLSVWMSECLHRLFTGQRLPRTAHAIRGG
eukprot:scaffold172208_cov21-Tisochrysis_lutea.AAC.1